ncbi:cytidine/deoxycytidylate deaminase family protein [Patescibacteria group bacterium]|nr:cytidine/deoxycytidylate deaminase family protein [Patescibacteria group bacterium]MBU4274682.1 cytidine/deoxycytidylate deaminase family protein [Patescibacteria group bacterium]MBU4367728.1 cytidine/deoxycytidylate deaminase family protein [Patescibacteria group bacterium]MBU4461822.1 cytidine/deoxycytidylate deaminase family protein [Patescibacteria group bacterium]MCG2700047.1 cytidine/deoxycytidylate deaminase family protein [Candidatus Parcubacteria bacterium]
MADTKRPSKDQYYLNIAKEIGERSTCFRAKNGAIIVRDDQIIATGYIGAPRKTKDCLERGNCLRDKLKIPHGERYELCRSVHAEQNAIINAARAGVSLYGGALYLHSKDREGNRVSTYPCYFCKRMIINAGIERVVCSEKEENNMRIFYVKDWVEEWREKDIVDDKYQYGEDQNQKEGLK